MSKIYNTFSFSRYFIEHLQPYCFVLKCLKHCSFYTLRVMSHNMRINIFYLFMLFDCVENEKWFFVLLSQHCHFNCASAEAKRLLPKRVSSAIKTQV